MDVPARGNRDERSEQGMEVTETVKTLCAPVVDEMGIELYDVERAGGILRVTVDCAGGVSLDQVAEATRRISRLLDEHDPVPGRYTLEVTSPGLERNLRTPEHFTRAVGMEASLRVRQPEGGAQRIRGTIVAVEGDDVVLSASDGGEVRVTLADIDRARTVFEWGPGERPGGTAARKKTTSGSTARTDRRTAQAHDDHDNEVSGQ